MDPGSLPIRDPIERWMNEISRLVEQNSSQGDTYVQRTHATRRREYPGGNSDIDGLENCMEIGDPLIEGDILTEMGKPPERRQYPGGGHPDGDGGPPNGGGPPGPSW